MGRGEPIRSPPPLGIVGQELSVLFHCRAASRRVDANEIHGGSLERRDVAPRESARALRVAGVRVQRAATTLARSVRDSVAVHRQHTFGRTIRLGEQSFHHAAGERRDSAAIAGASVPGGARSSALRQKATRGTQHRHGKTDAPRQARQQPSDSRGSQDASSEHREAEQPRTLERRQNDARDARKRPMLGDRFTRCFEQESVRDAGRARGLARTTAETTVDVRPHAVARRVERSVVHRSHQHDSAARAVVLVLERHVRRACLEAESAVHACVESGALAGERRAGNGAVGGGRDGGGGLCHDTEPRMP